MLDIKSEPASNVMRNVSIFYYYYYYYYDTVMWSGEAAAEREVFGERKESAAIRERCGGDVIIICVLISQ